MSSTAIKVKSSKLGQTSLQAYYCVGYLYGCLISELLILCALDEPHSYVPVQLGHGKGLLSLWRD